MQRGRAFLFTYAGSPARFRGSGNEMSASFVWTRSVGGEPMKIHCIPGYVSALYLVEYPEQGRVLLLDSGFPSDLERVRFYVEEVMGAGAPTKRRMSESVRLVVATHSHVDHAGASKGYEDCGIPVAYPSGMENCYSGLKGRVAQMFESSLSQFVAGRLGRSVRERSFLFSGGLLGPFWQMPTGALRLDDATPLPLGFHDWVAIRCPGHTAHMVCLYHPYSRIFYASDMFVSIRRRFFPPLPLDFEWAYNRTLHRLRRLPTRCALLAHGGIIDVEDRCVSWNALIDEVVHNCEPTARESPRFERLRRLIAASSSVLLGEELSPDTLPRGPLPLPREGQEPPHLHVIDF
ncbi:putative metallo-beta-lactamase superfamily [Trypanosoma conorhini]|uniref:Putative metallo-beta-lactamase superfamily n=1 Tax=Trypanosoma conorhini TaxID=83891 RepID=A0A422PCS9_9TRYP|nr:putative metallo-beta-lactamase superfamily [Trypanosoma conorhini]RNF15493.1 putative metallo-beta-lactamase superfamily [Trypanosoma conorhini]